MIAVVSGIRNLHGNSYPVVQHAMDELLAPGIVREVRFGGARGADTVALRAARRHAGVSLVVIVPATVDDQPLEARKAIAACADHVIELKLPLIGPSFLRRNDVLLKGNQSVPGRANQLVAFTDGRERGGTAYTMRAAKKIGLPIQCVTVRSRWIQK